MHPCGEDVIQDRITYLRRCRHLALRTPVWVTMTKEKYAEMKKAHVDALPNTPWRDVEPAFVDDATGKVEVHVDQFADTCVRDTCNVCPDTGLRGGCTSVRWDGTVDKSKLIMNEQGIANTVCEYGHLEAVCRCHMPIYHIGQDESIYKAYALPKGVWIINGVRGGAVQVDCMLTLG